MRTGKENFPLRLIVAISFVIMIAVNALANIIPINGLNTGQVSDFYENLFAPAGITFSIWGVIYLLLLLYTIYQFGFFQEDVDSYKEELFKKIGIYFSISSILNSIWILAWHYRMIEISLVIIILMLICLIIINEKTKKATLSLKDRIFIKIPFSIYFGWLTIATIANVTTLLVKVGWNGFGIPEQIWTIAVLIVGLLIGVGTMVKNKDFFYGLVIIWAYIGIYIKHTSATGYNSQYGSIIGALIPSLVILVLSEIYVLFKKRA